MKKMLSCAMLWVIMLALLTTQQIAYATSDVKYVSSKYLKEMDLSAEHWYALDIMREHFVLFTILDCLSFWSQEESNIAAEAIYHGSVYMVKDSEDVSAWFFSNDYILMFLYDTEADNAYYVTISTKDAYLKAERYMEALQANGDIPVYVKIDCKSVMELMDTYT